MSRTNLFRFLTSAVAVFGLSVTTFAQHGNGYWAMPGIHVPRSSYQAPVIDYYQGQHPKVWDDNQPIEKLSRAVAQRSWIRFEYLHWDFEGPGSGRIGAPVSNFDTLNPLTVFDNLNGGISSGIGLIPDLSQIDINDASGFRGTWGLDLQNADMELEFFGTHDTDDQFSVTNISAFRPTGFEAEGTETRPNIVVPLLGSGAVVDADSANYMIFDSSFEMSTESQIWGAEITFLTEPYVPGEGFAWQWLGGFRYVNYDERFAMRGEYNNGGLLATPEVTQFNSTTKNNMYGPEAGFRWSLNHRWFKLSATPRVAMAINDVNATTNVNSLRGNVAPTGGFESEIDFTPVVQVSLSGEIFLTPHFSLYGGYDFMWMYRVSRPYENLVFDSSPGGAGSPVPDITQDLNFETFDIRGFSFGCVLTY